MGGLYMEITKMDLFRILQGRKKGLLLTFIAFSIFANAQLVTYPEGLKAGMQHNDDYTVRVRVPGGEWKDLFEYNVSVDMDNVQSASMVQFDMGSPVEVMVKKNNGLIQDVQIRPLVNGIRHTVNQNTILFTLEKPRYLSVEFNGDRLHNLHLFANPLETETYSESSADVMYFGPGIHRPQDVPNNQIRIPSNTTVYLAPGAVVKAKLLIDKAENVRIIGRGILDHPLRGIEVTYSKNVLVDGITIVNPDHYTVFGGETTGLTIKNLKSFSCKGWSDGIDLMCCNEVLIDNVFMRNSDDCIAVYAHRWNYYGGSKNITLQNSILWADIAHPVNIGGHGNSADEVGETVENITVRNIDILEHEEDDPLLERKPTRHQPLSEGPRLRRHHRRVRGPARRYASNAGACRHRPRYCLSPVPRKIRQHERQLSGARGRAAHAGVFCRYRRSRRTARAHRLAGLAPPHASPD